MLKLYDEILHHWSDYDERYTLIEPPKVMRGHKNYFFKGESNYRFLSMTEETLIKGIEQGHYTIYVKEAE